MSGHTPGPWKAIISSVVTEQGETKPFCSISQSETGEDIAYMTLRPHEVEANARLIAAAPDMINALKWLLDVSEGLSDRNDGTESENKQRAQHEARAAIARAEGEQP